MARMQWGGSLGQVTVQTVTFEARAFGSFEGNVPPGAEPQVQQIMLWAVTQVAAKNPMARPDNIAAEAQALAAPHLAGMGVQGTITVTGVSIPPDVHDQIQAAQRAAIQARMAAQQPQAPQQPQQPQMQGGLAPGAQVLVQWSDGQRYPGTVRDVNPQQQQVHVAFPNGASHWVPLQYVSPA